MKVHIALLGENPNHIKTSFNRFERIDKLVLITSEKFKQNAITIQKNYSELLGTDVSYYIIDPFNKDSVLGILDIVKKIRSENVDADILMNITGGTNLMAGIALSTAFMLGCEEIYYLLDPSKTDKNQSDIIKIPIPRINFSDIIGDKKKELLIAISNKLKQDNIEYIINIRKFADEFYHNTKENPVQTIMVHLKPLEQMNLIRINRDSKERRIELTEAGKVMLRNYD